MKRKTIYKIASLVMTLVMTLGSTIQTTAALPAATVTSPLIYWGAMVNGNAPSSTNLQGVFNTFETRSGKSMSIIHWGQSWIMRDGSWGEFQTSYFNNVRNRGSIPMLNWDSQRLGGGINQADFQLRDVYNGTYDAYIRRWATDAKNWGHPFFLYFDPEMNGWWEAWAEGELSNGAIVNDNSPGDYVRAWRHVHDIFTSVGATNATWVWAPNHMSRSSRYPALATLYPGDAYVDWTGLSVYNKYDTWAGLNPLLTGSEGMTWFRNSYNDILSLAPNKPMMLAQWASIEAGDGGAKKAAWITDALTVQIPTNFTKIKAIVWFNWQETPDETYPIESSQAATTAWAAGIASPIYAINQYSNLNTSPIPPLTDSTFFDVPSNYWAVDFIDRIYRAGITGGCGSNPLAYCPEGVVNRAQMAVFLERSIHSSVYVPPAVGDNTGFNDIPRDYWAAAWIKELAAEGITGGCGDGNYCPELSVTRSQMAVFLLRSKHGSSYSPPPIIGNTGFGDVPTNYWAAAWIKQLVAEGITAGCGNGDYCPEAVVTRAQMPVFLVRTFNLP
jgi:hypothetical protein